MRVRLQVKRLYLVRHGESASNAGLVTESPVSNPITGLGEEQAKRFATTWGVKPDLVVTSPFVRTKQTAAPLRALHPDIPHEEWPVEEFTQLSPDKYHGTTHKDRMPKVIEYWARADPNFCDGPGAESFITLTQRITKLFESAAARDEDDVAVFTHGTFMQAALFSTLVGRPRTSEEMTTFYQFSKGFPIPNLGVMSFRYDQASWLIGRIWDFSK